MAVAVLKQPGKEGQPLGATGFPEQNPSFGVRRPSLKASSTAYYCEIFKVTGTAETNALLTPLFYVKHCTQVPQS